jgi:hypothetical protein
MQELDSHLILAHAALKRYANVKRWFDFVEATKNSWIALAVSDLNATSWEKEAVWSAAGASYDIGLGDIGSGVVTWFPPEPSGYLHIEPISQRYTAVLQDGMIVATVGGAEVLEMPWEAEKPKHDKIADLGTNESSTVTQSYWIRRMLRALRRATRSH